MAIVYKSVIFHLPNLSSSLNFITFYNKISFISTKFTNKFVDFVFDLHYLYIR